uniref:(northern house mosquito) hypothetical protein n=1 Tax=Culex pipiens TaxID=7175 RepID=A0A8D8HUJ1_CULPI
MLLLTVCGAGAFDDHVVVSIPVLLLLVDGFGETLDGCSVFLLRTASTTSSLAAAADAVLRLTPDGTRARGWSHLRGNLDDLLLKICCCCSAGTLVSWFLAAAGSPVRLRGRTSLPRVNLHSLTWLLNLPG